MPSFAGAEYLRHPQEDEEETQITFEEMPLQKFAGVVGEASLSNADRRAATIAKADSCSFWAVHPEYLQTENNTRLINHYLQTNGIKNPSYYNFEAACQSFAGSDLLDMDAAELARDRKAPRTFKGVLTGKTFYSVDDLISNERLAALAQPTPVSAEEEALYAAPIEEAQQKLRDAEREAQRQANAPEIQMNADAFLLLRPEIVDDDRNGRLITQQLKVNGVTNVTIEDFDYAVGQLRASGLLKLNEVQLNKQRAAEVKRRAKDAAPAIFDHTTEAEMELLPLDEIRRRASGNFSGF